MDKTDITAKDYIHILTWITQCDEKLNLSVELKTKSRHCPKPNGKLICWALLMYVLLSVPQFRPDFPCLLLPARSYWTFKQHCCFNKLITHLLSHARFPNTTPPHARMLSRSRFTWYTQSQDSVKVYRKVFKGHKTQHFKMGVYKTQLILTINTQIFLKYVLLPEVCTLQR